MEETFEYSYIVKVLRRNQHFIHISDGTLSTSISKNHAISRKIDLWGFSDLDEILQK